MATMQTSTPRDLCLATMLATLAAAATGHRFGTGDQAIHLTFLRRILDPHSMEGDLVAAQGERHASLFWQLQAPLVEVIGWASLPTLYAVIWAISLVGTFFVALRLSRTLFGAGWIGPLMLVTAKAAPGHVFTLSPELIPRSVALPLLLWAIDQGLRGRVIWAAAVAGLVFNVHATSAAHVALGLGGLALVDPGLRRRVLLMGAAFLLAALPVLRLAMAGDGLPLWIDEVWMHTLQWRMPHHLFPARWPPSVWVTAAWQLTLFTGALVATPSGLLRRRLAGLGLGFCVFASGLGTLVAGPWPVAPLLALHLWQAWLFIALLGYLGLGAWVVALWRRGWPKLAIGGLLLGLAAPEATWMGIDREGSWYVDWSDLAPLRDPELGWVRQAPAEVELWRRPAQGSPVYVAVKDGGETLYSRQMAADWRARLSTWCGRDPLAGSPTDWRGYLAVRDRVESTCSRLPATQIVWQGLVNGEVAR